MKLEELFRRVADKQDQQKKENGEVGKDTDERVWRNELDCLLDLEKSREKINDDNEQNQMDCLSDIEKENERAAISIQQPDWVHALEPGKDACESMRAVNENGGAAYALVAPAFLGQFREEVTPGKLRSAMKALGFTGMVEVALFADVLTLKEALEFERHVHKKGDFQLTSCCCPVWIAMIRKEYKDLMPHVPGAVSPMIACGRMIKKLHPDAVTVFIGPCLAKKKEAKEPDVAGAVDYVLTFQEMQQIFEAAQIRPEACPESEKDHSSRAGRIYARTGGVSEAVQETVKQLCPDREIQVKAEQADGARACKEMIERIRNGETDANFFEGMGCPGGCVGGPRAVLDVQEGRKNVEEYGKSAAYATPLENPYVPELLKRLGFETVEQLLEESDILERHF